MNIYPIYLSFKLQMIKENVRNARLMRQHTLLYMLTHLDVI